MSNIIFLIRLFFVITFFIGIPIGISIIIYKFIKNKKWNKTLRIFAIIPVLLISYIIYTAIYPSENFYKEDFKEVTGINFPVNGKIIYKTASFPDHFGDYTSISIIETDRIFYNKLPIFLKEKGFIKNGEKISTSQNSKILTHLNNLKIIKEYSYTKEAGIYYYVGFLSDNKTIIAERLSW